MTIRINSLTILFLSLFLPTNALMGQESDAEKLFELIDLEADGLQATKAFVEADDYDQAKNALLAYYRSRKNIKHPEINYNDRAEWAGKTLSTPDREKAEKGMQHIFYVTKGYGYFDYGEDIDWQHWPVKDNEVRWQLHRMYWWIPMGKMYWSTGDEKYAKEWIFQFRDWIKDNPLGLSKENDRFAWRPLETSTRIQDQTALFNIFLHSPHFTADFLIEFLLNYHTHCERVSKHYSKEGNHLLFEAQRMLYAGGFFQEFKNAKRWRMEGVGILNYEIVEQIHEDGYQYELSPNYHMASIHIFLKGLRMAKLCGMEKEFPPEYKERIRSMIHAAITVSYPNMAYPMFGDAQLAVQSGMVKQYKNFLNDFPEDKILQYYASKGKRGELPPFLSKPLSASGLYTFRNGWDAASTVMIMRAGIPGGPFHSQPDNGTFELWYKGTNLMPDSGCYVYSGDKKIMEMRNWYRQSAVHQTLTLDDQDIAIDGKELLWKAEENLTTLVYENPSYEELTHRRSVFFVDRSFFVIVDEATGPADGTVRVRYQLKEGKVASDDKNNTFSSLGKGGNIKIFAFSPDKIKTLEEDLKVSYKYRKEKARKGVAFTLEKDSQQPIRMISVIYPHEGDLPKNFKVKASFQKHDATEMSLNLSVNNQDYRLGYAF